MIGNGYLTELLRHGQSSLNAVANLGIGAALVPEGLAIMSSDYYYLPLVITITPPHWIPVKLRSPDWKKACDGSPPQCARIVDPIISERECPATIRLQRETVKVAENFARRYSGAVNPRYYAQLLRQFCTVHKGLCVQPNSRSQLARRKRIAPLFIVGGLLALLSVANSIGVTVNAFRISSLAGEVNAVVDAVDQLASSMLLMEKTITQINIRGTRLTRMITEGLTEVYTLMERMRCADFHELESVQQYAAMQIYRQYLDSTFNAIFQTSSTGKVSPQLVGVPQVRQLLASHSILRKSLIMEEPSLFYKYTTAYPVPY
jgi:hypothetical protein